HARLRRRGHRPARAQATSKRRRDQGSALGEPLPVHRLREDPRRGEAGSGVSVTELQVGRAVGVARRPDAVPKATGEFAFSSDVEAAGMLWGHTLRAPHAHALVRSIDVSEALTMPGVHAVLTHEDVPGQKTYG